VQRTWQRTSDRQDVKNGHGVSTVDKKLQNKNEAARLRRRESKAWSLAAKAEAQERIARGERGDGRTRRQVSLIDYKILATTGQRVAKPQAQQRVTVKLEARELPAGS